MSAGITLKRCYTLGISHRLSDTSFQRCVKQFIAIFSNTLKIEKTLFG